MELEQNTIMFFSIVRSRFAIILISVAYLVCLVYVIALTSTQWKSRHIEHLRTDFDKKQSFYADLMGPLEIEGQNGRWGWPLNNSILRLISFMFLTVSIIISWCLMECKRFGTVWKLNLLLMFICIVTCFRYIIIVHKFISNHFFGIIRIIMFCFVFVFI